MNSLASQSSNCGWLGGLLARPKSCGVGTSAWPKWRSQIWFAATRAVSGLFVLATQRAKARRRPVLVLGNFSVVRGLNFVSGSDFHFASASVRPFSASVVFFFASVKALVA